MGWSRSRLLGALETSSLRPRDEPEEPLTAG